MVCTKVKNSTIYIIVHEENEHDEYYLSIMKNVDNTANMFINDVPIEQYCWDISEEKAWIVYNNNK